MVDFPPSIALDGCRTAYLCIRQAQYACTDETAQKEGILCFSSMAKNYAEMVLRHGNIIQRWKAKQLLKKVLRSCGSEG
ncbi:hypothetical protein [Azospirillum argentinense]|uniref:hypothetical protein n=1 Tax=Azospirillum argentinense TaxID=2970906 RepID=UPI0038B3F540